MKYLLFLLMSVSAMAAGNGPYPFPSGGGNITNGAFTGSFTGDGGGLTNLPININVITNTQPNVVISGIYSTFTYSGTNPISAGNAFQAPAVNGTYTWSTVYKSYTNAANTNYVFYFNVNLGEWEFTTNNNDTTGNASLYSYNGANNFPTNDPANWIFGNVNTGGTAAPSSFDIGNIATSNNPVISMSPSGLTVANLDNVESQFFKYKYAATGQTAFGSQIYIDGTSTTLRNDQYAYASQTITNFVDAAHNFATAIIVYYNNGACYNIGASDQRGIVHFANVFGPLVVTNGVADLSHAGDYGAIEEDLVRRHSSFSTSVQGGVFNHPLNLMSDGGVMLGNIPESEHGIYRTNAAWVVIREGTTGKPQFMLDKTPIYTGQPTNGYFYSDGQWMHVGENSNDLYILSGTAPNNGSGLTNIPPLALSIYTSTNTLPVSTTGLTNNTLDTYFVSITAGTLMAIKDGNGNQFMSPVVNTGFFLKPNFRFTGTGVTGTAQISSK